MQRLLLLGMTVAPLLAAGAPTAAPHLFPARYSLSPAARAQIARLADRARDIEIPLEWRQRNWVSAWRSGSCVWASTVTLLRWQGHHYLAGRIRGQQAGGADPDSLARTLDREGVRYAATYNGDVRFLEWCIRTRRGACVRIAGGAHMVNLVGLDDQTAELLDNNDPQRTYTQSRAAFIHEWQTAGGAGWAFTPVYSPPAPPPWILKFPKETPQ